MRRLVGYAVGLVVLLALVASPALFWNAGSGGDTDETTTITDYRADYRVDDSGDLAVTETITVDFPNSDKHGIFRFFDTADSGLDTARVRPRDIEVTMDGGEEPFEVLDEQHGRLVNVKIGDPDVYLSPGEHTYEISYAVDGVLLPDGDRAQFFWDVVPGGWLQPITKARISVRLPAATVGDVGCAVGIGASGGCTAEGAGTDTLAVQVFDLAPQTPVTLRTDLDMAPTPLGEEVPWAPRFDRVLGTHPVLLTVVGLLAIGLFLVGAVLARRNDESDPGFGLLYAPPSGIGPAQANYVLREDVGQEQFVATLMYAAERGAIGLERHGDAWTITDKGPDAWAGLDPVTRSIAHLLPGAGGSFTAGAKDVEAGKRLKAEIDSFETAVKSWGTGSGNLVTSAIGTRGGLLVLVALVVAGVGIVWNPLDMTALALIPGAFAVGGAPLWKTGADTTRTSQGRQLWSQVGGFHRILSTESAEARFDFAARRDAYTAFLPWAVAFSCAEEWERKYRIETHSDPPQPSYIGGYYGAWAAGSAARMVSDFDSTVSSAISSYEATQSSSSGGGGFGGGGGGGGGGGSW
ncbi:DUF2207 domain-containing protein [Nocardioides fonticola]|uniref:DUF2207 domain-containing protein n=1 Tax=Nocardioides fonticola TaxID=450363 RepID=A0ABP7XJS7_9ACTN